MALRISRLRVLWPVLGTLCGLLSACQNTETAPASNDAIVDTELNRLEQQLRAMLVHAQRCEYDRDCAVLPLGHRACGGPDRYAAYATLSPSAERVEQLAARHRQLSAQQHAGRMGICVVTAVPHVQCVQRLCAVADTALDR